MGSLGLRTQLAGAIFLSLVLLAPCAWAGDFDLDAPACDSGIRVKFGASGQAYLWRDGGC